MLQKPGRQLLLFQLRMHTCAASTMHLLVCHCPLFINCQATASIEAFAVYVWKAGHASSAWLWLALSWLVLKLYAAALVAAWQEFASHAGRAVIRAKLICCGCCCCWCRGHCICRALLAVLCLTTHQGTIGDTTAELCDVMTPWQLRPEYARKVSGASTAT